MILAPPDTRTVGQKIGEALSVLAGLVVFAFLGFLLLKLLWIVLVF